MLFDKEKIKGLVLEELIKDPNYRRALAIVLAPEIKKVMQHEESQRS